jgi:hypothetical protein
MSATDVLARFGTWALVKFVAALLVFVVLHLVRMPVRLLVVLLDSLMSRVDGAVTAAVSKPFGSRGAGAFAGEGI